MVAKIDVNSIRDIAEWRRSGPQTRGYALLAGCRPMSFQKASGSGRFLPLPR